MVVPNGVAFALRVDVNELVVVGDVGELVDLVLGDLEPVAGSFVVADIGLKQGERLLGSFAHAATLEQRPAIRNYTGAGCDHSFMGRNLCVSSHDWSRT